MTAATALVGPVRAVLYVRSNASDTDFSAKMSDGACTHAYAHTHTRTRPPAIPTAYCCPLTSPPPTPVPAVYPDGRSHLITEGFVRMRWRHIADANKAAWSENGRSSAPSLRGPDGLGTLDNDVPTAPSLQPGRLYRVEVDMWSTALIVNAGHSIRLTVTSSNDPRFSVNPNTGQPLGASPRQPPVVAENAIAHDSAHPSALVLPVVPLSAVRAARTPAPSTPDDARPSACDQRP